MFITDLISITELSRITQKSRPTIYKYISDYKLKKLDYIPYSFTKLLKMSETDTITRLDIIQYCYNTYTPNNLKNENEELSELIELLENHKDKLDISKIKKIILEELNNAR